jgi:hypothetical protein
MSLIQDPFKGLIDGVLQGHAIATQLRQQAMQEENFQRMKVRDDNENQMRDMQLQEQIMSRGGRQVTNGMVEDPGIPANPGPVSTPLGIPSAGGMEPTAQTDMSVPSPGSTLRKAGGNGRSVMSWKDSQGRPQQYEIPSQQEQLQQQINHARAMGQVTAEGGAMNETYKLQAANQFRQERLKKEGIPVTLKMVQSGVAVAGQKILPEEFAKYTAEAKANLATKYQGVKEGESLYAIPQPDMGPPAAPQASPSPQAPAPGAADPEFSDLAQAGAQGSAGLNPLMQARFALQQKQQAFVDSAHAAGAAQPPTGQPQAAAPPTGQQPQLVASSPPKPTNKTDAQLAFEATDPSLSPQARAAEATKRLDESRRNSRPVNNNIFQAPGANTPGGGAGKAKIEDVPANVRDEVAQVLNYAKPLPANSRMNPRNQAINYWVSRVGAPDPATGDEGYKAGSFANRNAWMRSEGSGDISKSIIAGNTLIAHAGTLYDSIDKLDNSSFKRYNSFANWLKAEGGSPQFAPFRAARLGVSQELSKLLKGGVATEGEVAGWEKELDNAGSPQALKTTVQTILHMAHDRTTSIEEQHQRVMGSPVTQPFITPRAQAVYDRINGTGGGGGHVIEVNGKHYKYSGSGDTADMKSYTEVK